jgi:hypothetical protein
MPCGSEAAEKSVRPIETDDALIQTPSRLRAKRTGHETRDEKVDPNPHIPSTNSVPRVSALLIRDGVVNHKRRQMESC